MSKPAKPYYLSLSEDELKSEVLTGFPVESMMVFDAGRVRPFKLDELETIGAELVVTDSEIENDSTLPGYGSHADFVTIGFE